MLSIAVLSGTLVTAACRVLRFRLEGKGTAVWRMTELFPPRSGVFYDVVSSCTIYCSNSRMSNELNSIGKEAVVAQKRYHLEFCLEELRKTRKQVGFPVS